MVQIIVQWQSKYSIAFSLYTSQGCGTDELLRQPHQSARLERHPHWSSISANFVLSRYNHGFSGHLGGLG